MTSITELWVFLANLFLSHFIETLKKSPLVVILGARWRLNRKTITIL